MSDPQNRIVADGKYRELVLGARPKVIRALKALLDDHVNPEHQIEAARMLLEEDRRLAASAPKAGQAAAADGPEGEARAR